MNRLEKLRAISPSEVLIFDTETTGLNVGGSRRDEILSLAVMNLDGDVLFCDLLKPSERKKWPKAESINGISPSMVKDKQTIIERRSEIEPIFKSAKLYVAYNADFDLGFLRASGLDIPDRQTFDVMKEFAKIHGAWDGAHDEWSWCKLEDCAAFYGYRNFEAHDALNDVKATAHCFNSILDDFLFGEPRRRPKLVKDEFGDSYFEYGDEEFRSIVCSGYAAASSDTDKHTNNAPSSNEFQQQAKDEKDSADNQPVRNHAVSDQRSTNKALVLIGSVCALIGLAITVLGAAIVGVPIAILGALLAVGSRGRK